jgi:hypothetical protein
VLLGASATGAADIYRWVDEDGQVHYSNAPSRMESREEPVVVPLPSGAPARPEAIVPEDGGETAPGEAEGAAEPATPAGGTAAPGVLPPAPGAGATGGAPSNAPALGTPAQTTLARVSLERDYRRARARLGEIDRELADLAAARTRFAVEGPAAVGGLAAVEAPYVRSPEEMALLQEREALSARLDDIRARYAALRSQVAAQHGGKPPAIWQELP